MKLSITLYILLCTALSMSAQVYGPPIQLNSPTQGIFEARFTRIGAELPGLFDYYDIAANTLVDKRMIWYNGSGQGRFRGENETELEESINFRFLVMDIDTDVDFELVTVSDLGQISVQDKTGINSYGPAIYSQSIGEYPVQIEAEDVNDDGQIELVVMAHEVGLLYFPVTGDGSISDPVAIEYFNGFGGGFQFGDFFGEGVTDIVYIDGQGQLKWVDGYWGGGFSEPMVLDNNLPGAQFPEVADIDSDGDDDILIADYQAEEVVLFRNAGGGVFTKETIIDNVQALRLRALDIDQDDTMEMIVVEDNYVNIYTYDENSGGADLFQFLPFFNGLTYDGFVTSVDIQDMNYDGHPDILIATDQENGLFYAEFSPSFGYYPSTKVMSSDAVGISAFTNADIDGDGDDDLVTASLYDQKIAWYEKLAPGQFGPQQFISDQANGVVNLVVLDRNGSGKQDIVITRKLPGTSNDRLTVLAQTIGGDFYSPSDIQFAGVVRSMTTGFLAPNAFESVIWTDDQNGGRIVRQTVEPDGNTTTSVIASDLGVVEEVQAADLDGDGAIDIVSAGATSKLSWLRNLSNGTSFAEPVIIDDQFYSYLKVAISDMDGDGDQDIVAVVKDFENFSFNHYIYWYENDGEESFVGHFGTETDENSSLELGDLEGDGINDILFHDPLGMPRWGSLSEQNELIYGSLLCTDCAGNGVRRLVAIDDADGDGDLDAYYVDDAMYYLENIGVFCPADINQDGLINAQDFIELNSAFGTSCIGYCPADIDGDGLVNIDDFIMLNSAYGSSCN